MIKKIILLNEDSLPSGKGAFGGIKHTIVWPEYPSIIDLPFVVASDLIKNDKITFRAASWCMFPVIWAGDILKVVPISPNEIKVGDIVLYKSAGRAYAHRLIATYEEGGRLYIITGGEKEYRDNQRGAGEGVLADNILGRVVEIRRRGVWFNPGELEITLGMRVIGGIKFYAWSVSYGLRSLAARILGKLQAVKVYRFFLKHILNSTVSVWIGIPILGNAAEINNFQYYRTLKEFLANPSFHGNAYTVSVRVCNLPVGNLIIHCKEANQGKSALLSDFIVRVPFRGGGIGGILIKKAVMLCQFMHMSEIRIVLSAQDKIGREFLRKFDFREDSVAYA